jgi:hypothetical protein
MATMEAIAPRREFDDVAALAGISDGAPSPGHVTDHDLLTDHIDVVLLAATTNCNLRCTYCGVSLPSYFGSDFDFSRIEKLVQEMVAAKVASAFKIAALAFQSHLISRRYTRTQRLTLLPE